jgi:hypothetical protein
MLWYDIVNFSLIILCIAVIGLKYNTVPYEIKFLLAYFILTFLLEITSLFFILKGTNNLFLYHAIIPFQYLITSYYLLLLLRKNRNTLVLFFLIISVAVMLAFSFLYTNLSEYYSFASILKNLLTSLLILLYFRKIFITTTDFDSDTGLNAWVCAGLFINCLGSFFIEGTMNYLMFTDREMATNFYYLRIGLDFFFYIVFLLSVLLKSNKVQNA